MTPLQERRDQQDLRQVVPAAHPAEQGRQPQRPDDAAVQESRRQPDRLGRPERIRVTRFTKRPRTPVLFAGERRRRELQLGLGDLSPASRGRHGSGSLSARGARLDARDCALGVDDRAPIGSIVGTLRTTPNRWVVPLGNAYVELFRNVPLLVQMFSGSCAAGGPAQGLGEAMKQMPPPWGSFVPAVLCLGFYTSARVAEQVRAGIQSLPRGQHMAGTALGLRSRRPTATSCCRRRSGSSCRRSPPSS